MTVYQVSWYLAMGGPHGGEKYEARRKSNKNWKSAKKASCNFLRHLCIYHGVSYVKKIPELIKRLKGYSLIFTYGREISNQNWHTNHWTPCMFSTVMFHHTHTHTMLLTHKQIKHRNIAPLIITKGSSTPVF